MKGTILASWLLTSALITLGAATSLSVKRSDRQMCEDVRVELEAQVEEGVRTQESADQVVQRCFDLFVNG